MRWRFLGQFVALPLAPVGALLLIGFALPRAVPETCEDVLRERARSVAFASDARSGSAEGYHLAAPRRLVLVTLGTAGLASRRRSRRSS